MGDSPKWVKSKNGENTPGTAGGPGGRDRTLAVKSRKTSSYAKILGGKLFRTWEFPRSGSKAKDGERKRERRD